MKFIKNIFGFADKDYDTDDDTNEPSHNTPYINPFKKPEQLPASEEPINDEPKTETEAEKTADQKIYEELTDKIIETLNSGLPDYIKTCIDTDAEKNYVRTILDGSFDRCISQLKEASLQEARSKWQSDRMNLEQRTAELEQQLTDSNSKIEELRGKNLSLERQKTTLNERVGQYESKASKAEAEREQYQLECRSLMNKLKVSAISEQRLDELTADNNSLREKAKSAETALKTAETALKTAETEKTEYEESIARLQKECEIKDADISNLQADKDSLLKQIEQLKEENRIKEQTEADNSAFEAKISQLQEEIASSKISCSNLSRQLDDKDSEIRRLNASLSDRKAEAEHLNSAIYNLEENKRIGEEKLRQEIKLLQTEKEELEKQLKKIEEEKKANAEVVVFGDSETSYTATATDPVEEKAAAKTKGKTSRRTPKKKVVSAIDYTTDYSDWLMPTPPSENIPIIETAEEPSAEEPALEEKEAKRNAPSQMELF